MFGSLQYVVGIQLHVCITVKYGSDNSAAT